MRTKFTVVSAACEQCGTLSMREGHLNHGSVSEDSYHPQADERERRAKLQLQTNSAGTEEEEVEEDAEDENADVAEDAAEGEDDAEEDDAEEEEEDAGDVEEGGENCGSGSEKRKRVHSDEDIDLHYVPALKKHHRSWKAFDAYLKKYSDRTSTKMVVNETLNVSLRNRRIKAQKQYKGSELSDEDQVAELLVNFNMSAEGNVSTVNENARGQTAVVSISSELMRKHYSRFPELLLVDCTHKTNQCVSSIQTHL
ncbi:hypothetical protein PF010_g24779 [Phytophthora fragariae]|uniref:ZSWIM1/3 RNaseH-like domain-containing protein n=1 Tax=Phytophthora fragariae TaxID=53985 RepID=A0A6G0K237_9STRA|nr:hypothetical protein PF010_g24779 [Phytophthora fragariae]